MDAVSSRSREAGSPTDLHGFLRGLIASGRLGAGEKLPTVRQAAADFGVAPGTVQKVYRALESEGLIVSRVGSGTRVASGVSALSADLTRRLRELVDVAVSEGVTTQTLTDVLRLMADDARST
ncbi:GntR family transcriptional regulator [Microbacterium sp. SORGH_AS 1204]|uniref:GntR family transcriptional regulator n=1 Tax=Microbacterium sp. SORGH_AS_1204 TaxID=3041785 RepID=UPI00279034BD|nr:GntR family transcriptional regulator [Microbacterium sp. SORGH_AS_1204]MDQ1136212.1 GntR family transcriptional regulator [Microbacterium sp. SORGH_AS_1204]